VSHIVSNSERAPVPLMYSWKAFPAERRGLEGRGLRGSAGSLIRWMADDQARIVVGWGEGKPTIE